MKKTKKARNRLLSTDKIRREKRGNTWSTNAIIGCSADYGKSERVDRFADKSFKLRSREVSLKSSNDSVEPHRWLALEKGKDWTTKQVYPAVAISQSVWQESHRARWDGNFGRRLSRSMGSANRRSFDHATSDCSLNRIKNMHRKHFLSCYITLN